MPHKEDVKASLAICAAIVGAGFASGREIVTFFAAMGWASWMGVIASASAFGGLTYVIMRISAHVQADSFPDLYGAVMGRDCRDAVHILHGLICLITSAAMLSAGSELGALALPWRHSHLTGFVLTLCIAMASVLTGVNALSCMGAVLIPLLSVYCLMMAKSSVGRVFFTIEGALATIPMGLLYAFFNIAVIGSTICRTAATKASPARTALTTGLFMLVMLSCANLAALTASEEEQSALFPFVIRSAKWGVPGFYATIAIMWAAVLSTLCAMLASLTGQIMSVAGLSRTAALLISAAASSLVSVMGFRDMVNVAYPLLGWVCAFVLIALILFLPAQDE